MSALSRPWYCPDRAVDEYKTSITHDGDNFRMLKTLKILRAIIVNVGVISLTAFLVAEGGDPTILGTLTLLILGGYNGLEMSDYLALLQAYREVQSQRDE